MPAVLVTGGAGYVGSHIVRRLREAGREVIVVDDFSEGHRAAIAEVPRIEGDFADPSVLERALAGGTVGWIVHMAASCLVGESMSDPDKYYTNNLAKSLALLQAAVRWGVRGIVFSSTAAVYGEPREIPIPESHPLAPTNPYGETKLAFERTLGWFHRAYGLPYVALRYFNAAGAHPSGDIGEDHAPESHLIPNLLRGVLDGGGEPVPIFGGDYPTSDGTCVRDYVHVTDLAHAHVLALEAMERDAIRPGAFNLGNGEGFSVREVVEAVTRVTGTRPATIPAPRREGDPAILVASSEAARRELGWRPEHPALEEIVRTAWRWHRGHPDGYGAPGAS